MLMRVWSKISRMFLSMFLLLILRLEEMCILVEKRKISYFVLARNLIQHWISPNQDDISYSARTFISS